MLRSKTLQTASRFGTNKQWGFPISKRTKKSAKQTETQPEAIGAPETTREAEAPAAALTTGIEDPIGDVSSGEGHTYLGDQSAVGDIEGGWPNAEEQEGADEPAGEPSESEQVQAELKSQVAAEAAMEPEFVSEPAPPAKLERLQKILSQAGIASRRRAEEMITEGRVQVNGTVVTELGSKADPGLDHIRVDGKLLHGAERHRYFVLNKPKGYVTTVSDPEGRPTVMEFFGKMPERLYPVGRLDYQSEGLLLVTNDGELANQLTKAGSGVEKTYLVKVAGRPTEDELGRLRTGVAIEHGAQGSKKVQTTPARVRQVRQGDNPWYEVVLIEGRNRELRKMFASVGHFVEKIRRVGYGPLVLDVEPGKLRELKPEEVTALRVAAEGKLPKPARRSYPAGAKSSPPPASTGRSKTNKQRGPREPGRPPEGRLRLGNQAGGRSEGRFGNKPFRGRRGQAEEFQSGDRRKFGGQRDSGRGFAARSGRGFENRPQEGRSDQDRPTWRQERSGQRPPRGGGFRPIEREERGGRPPGGQRRDFGNRQFDRPRFDRPAPDRSGLDRPGPDRSGFDRPRTGRPAPGGRAKFAPGRPSRPRPGQPSRSGSQSAGFKSKTGGPKRGNSQRSNKRRG